MTGRTWNDDVPLLGAMVAGLDDPVVCSTSTVGATISANGRYARLGPLGAPWPAQRAAEQITLRLCPSALDSFGIDGDTVRLLNNEGDVVHRIACDQQADVQVRAGTTLRSSPWHHIGCARAATNRLTELDTQGQLDTLVADGGSRRLSILNELGRSHLATPVAPALGLHALHHLGNVNVTVGVPTTGCLMAVRGTVTKCRDGAGLMTCEIEAGTLRVETTTITEAWVVRPDHGSAILEFYDHTGHCAFVIAQPGRRDPVTAARWEHLTAMISISD